MPIVTHDLEAPFATPSRLLVAVPVATDRQRLRAVTVEGAEAREIHDVAGRRTALLLDVPAGGAVTVAYAIDEIHGEFDERLFAPTGGRHETPSAELADLVATIAPVDLSASERIERIVRHVEERFTYGVRAVGLGDDTAAIEPLACDVHLGTCVDTHSYAVAAMRAAGLEAVYLSGVFFHEGETTSRPGHCWFAVRADGVTQTWDVSHFLKYGLGPVRLVDNPKPGRRFALSAGRDLVFAIDGHPYEASRLCGFLRPMDDGTLSAAATRARLIDDET